MCYGKLELRVTKSSKESQMLVNVTHEKLVLTEKAHTAKSCQHTTQRTCLSSHLPVGLGVFPHSLLLVERQMEAHEMMQL